MGTPKPHKLLTNILLALHKLMVRPFANNNTYITHETQRSCTGAYLESLPLWTSVYGTGMYPNKGEI